MKKLWTATGIAAELGVSDSYICAVKKAMGTPGRWLDIDAVRQWIIEHPDFRCRHVWPGAARAAKLNANLLAETADKPDESSRWHDSPAASPRPRARQRGRNGTRN